MTRKGEDVESHCPKVSFRDRKTAGDGNKQDTESHKRRKGLVKIQIGNRKMHPQMDVSAAKMSTDADSVVHALREEE